VPPEHAGDSVAVPGELLMAVDTSIVLLLSLVGWGRTAVRGHG